MPAMQIFHETIIIERSFDAPLARVFAAFADPVARAIWGLPSDTAVLIYDESDFRVGGRDLFRCGAKSDPKYHGEARYLHIEHERHIVYCETIDVDGSRLSASVNSVEFESDGQSTRVKTTVQLAAFRSRDMIEGIKFGQNAALDNLGKFLA